MRLLLIIRHAKSDWDSSTGDDHGRSLAPRGVKAAAAVGRFVTEAVGAPQLVLSSSAVRARTTAELAAEAGRWRCEIDTTDSLYGAAPEDVIERVGRVPDKIERVVVAGHEPGCSRTVSRLVGGGRLRFPTAAVACMGFDSASWSRAMASGGQLLWMITPRLLKRILR